jgi:predicted nucleotidyltransferase
MMEEFMTRSIQNELSRIEEIDNIAILYACESGSRAWGFESADSDYDVGFIYLRRTLQYLTVESGREVIEKPLDNGIDLSGWALIKATESLIQKIHACTT